MTMTKRLPALLLALAALPLVAAGEWYEDYESGKGNCDAGNYGTCIAKMQAAIGKKPKSEKSARTYGMNFVAYTPYYYLGLAYFNQGNIPKAVDAFNKEADMGVIFQTPNSGSFSVMSKQATQALAAMSKPADPPPAPAPTPAPVAPAPTPTPVTAPPTTAPAPSAPVSTGHSAPAPTTTIVRYVPMPGTSAPTTAPAPTPTTAPATPVSAQGANVAAQQAVRNMLSGEFGIAANTLEQATVSQTYGKNAGYYLLLAYAYYCRSFTQPENKSTYDDRAKGYIQQAAKINPTLVPDSKLFPRKFIEFYKNNI